MAGEYFEMNPASCFAAAGERVVDAVGTPDSIPLPGEEPDAADQAAFEVDQANIDTMASSAENGRTVRGSNWSNCAPGAASR